MKVNAVEQHAVEQAVGDSSKPHALSTRAQSMIDGLAVPVVFLDIKGVLEYANAAFLATFGLETAKCLGHSLSAVLGDAAAPLASAARGRVADPDRHDVSMSWRGSELHFTVDRVLETDSAGNGCGICLFMYDMTASKRETQQLLEQHQANEKRWESIASNVPALISHVDADARYLYANNQFTKLLGLDPRVMLGRRMNEVLDHRYVSQIQPKVEAALAGAEIAFESTVEALAGQRHLHQHYVPDLENGEVKGFYSISVDVSEHERDRLRLAESERRIKDITDHLPVLISYIDSEQHLRFLNRTFKRWLGIEPQDLVGRRLLDVVGLDQYAKWRDQLEAALRGRGASFDIEINALGVRRILHNEYVPDMRPDRSIAGIYVLSMDC